MRKRTNRPIFQGAEKAEAEIRRLSDFPGGPLGLLWPATGPLDSPGALGRCRHKIPGPAPPVGGVGLTGFDFVYTCIVIDNLYIALHRPAPARGISPAAAAERQVSHTVRLAECHYSY